MLLTLSTFAQLLCTLNCSFSDQYVHSRRQPPPEHQVITPYRVHTHPPMVNQYQPDGQFPEKETFSPTPQPGPDYRPLLHMGTGPERFQRAMAGGRLPMEQNSSVSPEPDAMDRRPGAGMNPTAGNSSPLPMSRAEDARDENDSRVLVAPDKTNGLHVALLPERQQREATQPDRHPHSSSSDSSTDLDARLSRFHKIADRHNTLGSVRPNKPLIHNIRPDGSGHPSTGPAPRFFLQQERAAAGPAHPTQECFHHTPDQPGLHGGSLQSSRAYPLCSDNGGTTAAPQPPTHFPPGSFPRPPSPVGFFSAHADSSSATLPSDTQRTANRESTAEEFTGTGINGPHISPSLRREPDRHGGGAGMS